MKPRVQGKIRLMPQSQRERLHQWFRENLTYSEIQKRLAAEFGIAISDSSLSSYYSANAMEFMQLRGTRIAPNESSAFEVIISISVQPKEPAGKGTCE